MAVSASIEKMMERVMKASADLSDTFIFPLQEFSCEKVAPSKASVAEVNRPTSVVNEADERPELTMD